MQQRVQSSLNAATQPLRNQWNAVQGRLDAIKIAGRPLTWYVSGWRLGLVFLVLAILYPQINGDPALLTVAVGVGVYVILALGLNIVVGFAGLLDLGYVAFFAIGSYVAAVGSSGLIQTSDQHTIAIPTFPFWVLLIAGAFIAAFFGVILGAPTLRLRGDYLAIVTLGFGEIVPIVFRQMPYFFGNLGISASPPADISTPLGTITFSNPLDVSGFYYLTLAIAALVIVLVVSLRDSSIGRAWVAIREDETAAAASGVNLVRTKLLAFGLGAMIGGIGGVINASFNNSVSPNLFNFNVSITVLAMVILGGLSSVPGVIVGAIILEFIDSYFLGRFNDFIHNSANHVPGFLAVIDFNTAKYLIFGIILVLMILVRPQGIIPNRRRQRELHGEGAAIESVSAVGVVASEIAGTAPSGGLDETDKTEYSGAGSDARGMEE